MFMTLSPVQMTVPINSPTESWPAGFALKYFPGRLLECKLGLLRMILAVAPEQLLHRGHFYQEGTWVVCLYAMLMSRYLN